MGNIKIVRGVFDTDYPVFKVKDPENFQIWGTVIHLIRTFEKL